MGAGTLFVHNVSIFRGFTMKLQWILNFIRVIDISGWLSSVQFLSVTLLVMEVKPRLFYRVVKNQGRPRPLTFKYRTAKKKKSFYRFIENSQRYLFNIDKDFVMFIYFLHHICTCSNINDKKNVKFWELFLTHMSMSVLCLPLKNKKGYPLIS